MSGLVSLILPLVLFVSVVISVLQVYFMHVIPPSVSYGYSKIDLYCALFFRVTGVARTPEAYELYDFKNAYYFDSIFVAAVLCARFRRVQNSARASESSESRHKKSNKPLKPLKEN